MYFYSIILKEVSNDISITFNLKKPITHYQNNFGMHTHHYLTYMEAIFVPLLPTAIVISQHIVTFCNFSQSLYISISFI